MIWNKNRPTWRCLSAIWDCFQEGIKPLRSKQSAAIPHRGRWLILNPCALWTPGGDTMHGVAIITLLMIPSAPLSQATSGASPVSQCPLPRHSLRSSASHIWGGGFCHWRWEQGNGCDFVFVVKGVCESFYGKCENVGMCVCCYAKLSYLKQQGCHHNECLRLISDIMIHVTSHPFLMPLKK